LEYTRLKAQNKVLQLLEIGGTETSNWIPAHGSVPRSVGDDATASLGFAALAVNAVAANGATASDVVEGGEAKEVEEWVQVSESRLANGETSVVQQSNDTGPDGGGSGGTAREANYTAVHNGVVGGDTECGNVGETTAVEVGVCGVVLLDLAADVLVQVGLDSSLLEPGAREVVAESTRAGSPGDLRGESLGSSDGGHVGAGGWENGLELGSVLAVVAQAAVANAQVSAGFQDRDTSRTRLDSVMISK
jgi:hypothetical protein